MTGEGGTGDNTHTGVRTLSRTTAHLDKVSVMVSIGKYYNIMGHIKVVYLIMWNADYRNEYKKVVPGYVKVELAYGVQRRGQSEQVNEDNKHTPTTGRSVSLAPPGLRRRDCWV